MDRLERWLGWIGIPRLTPGIVVGQAIMYLARRQQRDLTELIMLQPAKVLQGEYWRLATFVFDPPDASLLFIIIALSMFYMMGEALENTWGRFRYNLFLLTGYLFTVGAAFLFPNAYATNAFLGASIFFAFAYLYPDFQILVYFVFPVRVKWLALLAALFYAYSILLGNWPTRCMVSASLANFFLYFGYGLLGRLQGERRARARGFGPLAAGPLRRCVVCGRSETEHPELTFVFCSRCAGAPCYCEEHARTHQHRTAAEARE